MGLDDGIALDRTLREALIESRQRFKDLVEISSDFAWETDAAGRFVYVSPPGALGWSVAELVGSDAAAFALEAGDGAVFRARAPIAGQELSLRRAAGGEAVLSISAVPVYGGAGAWRGARGLARDVTDALRRDRALAVAQLRLKLFARILRAVRDEPDQAAALDAAISELCLAVGAAGGVVLRGADPAAMTHAASWGAPPEAAMHEAAAAAFAAGPGLDWHGGECHAIGHLARCRQRIEGALLLWRDDENNDFAELDRALVADVADYAGLLLAQLGALEQVVTASRTDPLTGLCNRRAFLDQLDRGLERLAHAGGDAPCGALLYIDLDHFKLVNDARGHAAGDAALAEFARILAALSRGGDLAARLGGDEFVLWIAGIGAEQADARAEQLRQACRPLAEATGDPRRPLGLSIGVALVRPGDGASAPQLLAAADRAMYRAKEAGR
jgi:diguanylate cyclase (GGDEF)-like protein/PAS domain S-box-containing protein